MLQKRKKNSFITIKQYYFKQKHCLKNEILTMDKTYVQ